MRCRRCGRCRTRAAPVLGRGVDTVRGWLTADLAAPRKQRHTARRVWQRLVDEQGARVAESTVRRWWHELKSEIGLGGRSGDGAADPRPGREAEVDFGDFSAVIGGERLTAAMFVLRLSHSGRAVHIAYGNVGTRVVPGWACAGVRGVRRGADREDPL